MKEKTNFDKFKENCLEIAEIEYSLDSLEWRTIFCMMAKEQDDGVTCSMCNWKEKTIHASGNPRWFHWGQSMLIDKIQVCEECLEILEECLILHTKDTTYG